MFGETESVLSEIESEMIADGLFTIGPGLNRAFRHPDLPELTEEQEIKYADLFQKLPFYGVFARIDDTTTIDVSAPPIAGSSKSMIYRYTHNREINPPKCTADQRSNRCGECSVTLKDHWHIEYQWSPAELIPQWSGRIGEGEVSEEEYMETYRLALEQCFAE